MIVDLQLQVMMTMIGAGSLIGLNLTVYDRYIIRSKSSGWRWITDGIFWCVQAFIVFLLLFQVNGGEWRMYVLLSIVCGFATYEACVKKIILSTLTVIDNIIKWIGRVIVFIFSVLIVTPVLMIWRLVRAVGRVLLSSILVVAGFLYRPFDSFLQYSLKKLAFFPKKIKKWLNLLYNRE